MSKLTGFVLGVWAAGLVTACGGDEGTGTPGASGASSSGGAGPGTTGTGGSSSTAKGGGSSVSSGGSTISGGGITGKGGAVGSGGASVTTGGSGGTSVSSGGSGGASGDACQTTCQKFVAAKCGDLADLMCSTACQTPTTCVPETAAYYDCAASHGTVACDAMMKSALSGCDSESKTLGLCTLCEPATDDTACGTCNKGSCCPQFKAYASASDIDGFDACVSADTCTTQACVDACIAMYPAAGKAYNAAVACQAASCGEQCYCAAGDQDTACATCLKTNCCDLVVPYLTASDGPQFAACIDPCTDQACVDDCAGQFPIAGAAYDALGSQCAATTCVTDCG